MCKCGAVFNSSLVVLRRCLNKICQIFDDKVKMEPVAQRQISYKREILSENKENLIFSNESKFVSNNS